MSDVVGDKLAPHRRDTADAELSDLSSTDVGNLLRKRLRDGCRLKIAGTAKDRAPTYLVRRYPPQYFLKLFGTSFFLAAIRRDNGFRYFVAYVQLPAKKGLSPLIYPRIFYKDSSLIWRSATHYIRSEHEHWVGKGDLKPQLENGKEIWYTAEETTDLPYEIQGALDIASRRATPELDDRGLGLVLRNAPDDRVDPYADFSRPRAEAMADKTRCINEGQPVAWFKQANDPRSLEFVTGYEPDFQGGLLATDGSYSKIYDGPITKWRIASVNRRIQYLFISASRHVWIIPPQAMSHDLISYGVRPLDVEVDEKLCIPGFEYHYMDDSVEPPKLHTQIPSGFAGTPNAVDPGRADASPWNEKMPVIQAFRKVMLDS